jgi:hypothetical protein
LETYLNDTREGYRGGKEEEKGGRAAVGGRGCDPYLGAAQPPVGFAVGPTAESNGGRSPTVGQPPFEPAVGLLPPLAVAVGA